MTQDYNWHREQARNLWVEKFFNEHHPEHIEWTQRRSLYCHVEDIASDDDEFGYALASFDEDMEQVKLIYDHKHGTCLKVKWESGAWWQGDRVHFYYCVLLPLTGVAMLEPAALARTKPKQRKLMWWN